MQKVYIATSREVGEKCKAWAKDNLPPGFELTEEMNHCDIFISVLYDKIIPLEYLQHLKGAFNFHPGKLPEYRGAATFSWAIINGEKEVGITLHKIDEGIDSGDVIDIQMFPVSETAGLTFKFAQDFIFSMFKKWFRPLLEGQYGFRSQDETKARIYYRKDLDTIKDLTRFVRALTFVGKESAYFFNANGEKIYLDYHA